MRLRELYVERICVEHFDKRLMWAVFQQWTLARGPNFHVPSPRARESSVGSLDALEPGLRAAYDPDEPHVTPLGAPVEGEHLYLNYSAGETFDAWMAALRSTDVRVPAGSERRVVYILPIGWLPDLQTPTGNALFAKRVTDYADAFGGRGMRARLLPTLKVGHALPAEVLPEFKVLRQHYGSTPPLSATVNARGATSSGRPRRVASASPRRLRGRRHHDGAAN